MKIINNKNGFIEKLLIDNFNIIYPWGIEFADSNSFFSLEGKGWNTNINSFKYVESGNEYNGEIEIKTSEGKFNLSFKDSLKGNKIIRSSRIVALENSYIMDFVIRYRFKKNFFYQAKIGNLIVKHNNKNLYNQKETNNVILNGKLFNIEIFTKKSIFPKNMKSLMYVRDMRDEWIIHSRILPNSLHKKDVLKLNVSWFNKALPEFISAPILKNKKIKKYLEYRGEKRKTSKFNFLIRFLKPSYYPMAYIQRGDSIYLETVMKVY